MIDIITLGASKKYIDKKVSEIENLPDVTYLETLIDNKLFTIQATSLVYNATSKFYEYTLLHNLNSTKIVYSITDVDNEELLNYCKKIDNNNLLVRNDEKCLVNIIINKGL